MVGTLETEGIEKFSAAFAKLLAGLDEKAAHAGHGRGTAMTRVAINGFGRIGRNFFRAYLERGPGFEVVAVNDIGDPKTMAHLLAFDSVLGPLGEQVRTDGDTIAVGERELRALSIPEPGELPWRELGIDVVVESTGRFEKRDKAQAHLEAGARTVARLGGRERRRRHDRARRKRRRLRPERHQVVSMASCTTNCVTPMAKVLQDAFGIERGFMTTVHAYTPTQALLDGPHKDLRRARAAAINLIPTTTGATRALGTVLPELEGKIGALAIRAPVPDGSIVDLVAELARPADRDEVNAAFREAAARRAAGGDPRDTPSSRSSPPTSSARPTRASSTAS